MMAVFTGVLAGVLEVSMEGNRSVMAMSRRDGRERSAMDLQKRGAAAGASTMMFRKWGSTDRTRMQARFDSSNSMAGAPLHQRKEGQYY